ncbi:unnamed protein product [Aphanomyces euteiches]|uniref:MORN repeat-containing protein 5 n=2 Tax=Aphanomyces euteiches TaxID=100861 RepID=A0A6G0WQD8_9STRA|nr:hypothetical protein Ae201684_012853 [Aphanomyces euteiches]KAH9097708.1 hypothetical protein Ae201684P_001184 [Aphanomyces euteiches]KAH9112556.1 hypothetical protein LEN26_013266 [Aphanomyces euteiches]KAH9114104.1 hypothetical protein AeMF1_011810 [Aphanomyces euteiches]KAH9145308.1 hypothetical protein AeRB84_010802 [Aphanomyces euteiches]
MAKRTPVRETTAATEPKASKDSQKKKPKQCSRLISCKKIKKDVYMITYDDASKYIGEIDVESRQRHGKGVFQTQQGDVMEGHWKDDRFHGFGTRVFALTRDRHEGMYYKDKRHGRGTYLWINGDKYIGEFYNGRMQGSGILLYSNGDVFEGTWSKGVIVDGTKTFSNGDKVQGSAEASTWTSGFLTGEGTKSFRNGDVYHGHLQLNVMSGHGRFLWANGDRYHGMWVCNQMQGVGHFESSSTSSSRDVYFGEFAKGQYHGHGRLQYASGAIYEGSFVAHRRHGRGVYRWIEGDITYEGMWENNVPSGMGLYICEAYSYHGSWKDGWPHGSGIYVDRQSACPRRHTFEYGRAIDTETPLVLDHLLF